MSDFDEYCIDLLEDSKRFLEIAIEKNKLGLTDSELPFLRSSLLIAFSSLEAFIYGISDDFIDSSALNDFEKSFLNQKDLVFDNGKFTIKDRLKMTRLIDRIEFILVKFKSKRFNKTDSWWSQINDGLKRRNNLVHPKEGIVLTIENVSQTLNSIITCIDLLFDAVYKRKFPTAKNGLISRKVF